MWKVPHSLVFPLISRSLRASPKWEHTSCPGTAADLVLYSQGSISVSSNTLSHFYCSFRNLPVFLFFFFFFAGSGFSFLICSADVHACIFLKKHGLFVMLGELGREELDAVLISPLKQNLPYCGDNLPFLVDSNLHSKCISGHHSFTCFRSIWVAQTPSLSGTDIKIYAHINFYLGPD